MEVDCCQIPCLLTSHCLLDAVSFSWVQMSLFLIFFFFFRTKLLARSNRVYLCWQYICDKNRQEVYRQRLMVTSQVSQWWSWCLTLVLHCRKWLGALRYTSLWWASNFWKAAVSKLTESSQKLTVWVILWVHYEVTECPQNEASMSFNVSSQWVRCELKFFTWYSVTVWPGWRSQSS